MPANRAVVAQGQVQDFRCANCGHCRSPLFPKLLTNSECCATIGQRRPQCAQLGLAAQVFRFRIPGVQIVVIAAAHFPPNYSRTLNAAPQSDNADHNEQLGLVCDASEPGSCCAGVQDRDSHCGVVVWCGLTSQRFLCRVTLIILFLSNKNLSKVDHTTQQHHNTHPRGAPLRPCAAAAFVHSGCSRLGGGGGEQRRNPPRSRPPPQPNFPQITHEL